jgi:glycerophosphoryl diester phosphodiesterase
VSQSIIRSGFALLGSILLMTGDTAAGDTKLGEGTSVIAHRGASAYAPENTLAAFQLAAEMNTPWFELDCTLTSDGDVVVIHDDTLDRTTPLSGKVIKTPTAQVIAADAGSWYDAKFSDIKIPTLDSVLEFSKDTIGVYIEIKDSDNDGALKADLFAMTDGDDSLIPKQQDEVMRRIKDSGTVNLELTRKVIQLVRDHGMEKEVVIQSFSPVICAIVLIEAPDLRTELLASGSSDHPEQWPNYQRWVRLINAHGFNIQKGLASKTLIDQMHQEGRTVAVWTVNGKREMQKLADMGADFIITNRPDVALETLTD